MKEDEFDEIGPDERDPETGEPYPVCEGCGRRHPPEFSVGKDTKFRFAVFDVPEDNPEPKRYAVLPAPVAGGDTADETDARVRAQADEDGAVIYSFHDDPFEAFREAYRREGKLDDFPDELQVKLVARSMLDQYRGNEAFATFQTLRGIKNGQISVSVETVVVGPGGKLRGVPPELAQLLGGLLGSVPGRGKSAQPDPDPSALPPVGPVHPRLKGLIN